MLFEHSEAAVTISIAGPALLCINKEDSNRSRPPCEVGIIACERHDLVLDIQEITLDRRGTPLFSHLRTHELRSDDDILIDVISPIAPGFTTPEQLRREGHQFHGPSGRGDEHDFRWVVDLEGSDFHDRRLEIRQLTDGRRSVLQPKIFISDGVLYAETRTDEQIVRVSEGVRERVIGRVAFKVGADLFPGDGGKVELRNRNDLQRQRAIVLDRGPYSRHHITIENICQEHGDHDGSDFNLLYNAVSDPDGRQFELRRVVENGGRGEPGTLLSTDPLFSWSDPPTMCVGATMGTTTTISR